MIKRVKIIKIFLLLIFFILCGTINSYAVLQSNGNAGTTQNLSDWIMNIRKMEAIDGGMGLSEAVNSDLTPKTSNGIDIHMQKNTEYGALAILSASSYGNPNKVTDGQTTTGNVSGVVMKINTEWVAAGAASEATNFTNAKARYKNALTSTYVKMNGDAVSETAGWHGSGDSSWINNYPTDGNEYGNWKVQYGWNYKAGFVRANSGSIFSYNGQASYNVARWASGVNKNYGVALYTNGYRSRAVIVQGEGF